MQNGSKMKIAVEGNGVVARMALSGSDHAWRISGCTFSQCLQRRALRAYRRALREELFWWNTMPCVPLWGIRGKYGCLSFPLGDTGQIRARRMHSPSPLCHICSDNHTPIWGSRCVFATPANNSPPCASAAFRKHEPPSLHIQHSMHTVCTLCCLACQPIAGLLIWNGPWEYLRRPNHSSIDKEMLTKLPFIVFADNSKSIMDGQSKCYLISAGEKEKS